MHELVLTPRTDQAWHYTATLTQNLNRGSVSSGHLILEIEGTRDGRLQRLDWPALRQQPDAAGVDYSFKYFQQLEGEVVLPPGFEPLRVLARLAPSSGAPVEKTLAWDEAARRRRRRGTQRAGAALEVAPPAPILIDMSSPAPDYLRCSAR